MASNRDKISPGLQNSAEKNPLGVRGGIAYRAASERRAGEQEYPRSLYVVVNVVLAVFALTVLLGLLLVFTPLGKMLEVKGSREQILYTLEFHDVNGDLAAAHTEGLHLVDALGGYDLGEIVGFEVLPQSIPTGQGDAEILEHDTAKTVSVTVALFADYARGVGYSVQGIRIAQGLYYTVFLGDSLAVGTCVSVEKGW